MTIIIKLQDINDLFTYLDVHYINYIANMSFLKEVILF